MLAVPPRLWPPWGWMGHRSKTVGIASNHTIDSIASIRDVLFQIDGRRVAREGFRPATSPFI